MAAIVDVIEFFSSLRSKSKRAEMCPQTKFTGSTTVAYAVYFMTTMAVINKFTRNGEYSYLLTIATGMQWLAFFILSLKVHYQKSVAGLSSRSLEMYAIFLICRLTTTLVEEGYLPADKTGDYIYQATDIGSLVTVLNLLYSIHKRYPDTYQSEFDTLKIYKIIPAVLVFACFVHGDLNRNRYNRIFDKAYSASLLFDMFALLPQLFMLSKIGGKVETMTSHFVATMVASRSIEFYFWTQGYWACAPVDETLFNVCGWMIMATHTVKLLLCADFMYYYVKGMSICGKTGVASGVQLPEAMEL